MDSNTRQNIRSLIQTVRTFNTLVNNIPCNKNKNLPFIILGVAATIIRYKDYFKILQLRLFSKKTKELNNFKDNYIDPCRFKKAKAIQPIVAFLFDIDTNGVLENDPRIGVFTRNLEDRGFDELGNNLKKRQYMSAFTLKKIPYYDTHLTDLFNSLHNDSIQNLPLLSSFSDHLVTYFLNIHLGKDSNRPSIVFDYFSDIVKIIGIRNQSDTTDSLNFETVEFAVSIKERACTVKEYFANRINYLKKQRPLDKSIIVNNWLTSGFNEESVQVAAFHNIVAFSQFLHTLFLICNNIIKYPDNNYLQRYINATCQKDINILIFDIFKNEVPNFGSASYDSKNKERIRHLHKETMENVDPDSKLYNKSIQNFGGDCVPKKCPFNFSSIDNETVLPCGAEKLIPVFDKPLYTPFGLGYRRCAGELLSYRFVEQLLNFLTNYKIKQNSKITNEISIGPGKRAPNNIYIKTC